MIDKNESVQAAQRMMKKTDPICPKCGSQGAWKYGDENIVRTPDSQTGVNWITLIVPISCANCRYEMEPYNAEN